MVVLVYVAVFLMLGFIIGMVLKDDEKAYIAIGVITIGWAFVMGPWAIATLIELIIGYSIAISYGESIGIFIVTAVKFLTIAFGALIIIAMIYKKVTNKNVETTNVAYVSPKEKCEKNGNIWQFDNRENLWECIKLYSLTINVSPVDARVRIMNIKPKYYHGIRLSPGRYNINVDKHGYYPDNYHIELTEDSIYQSTLKQK